MDPFPALQGLGARLSEAAIGTILREGRNLMPPFSHLSDQERAAVIAFIMAD